MLFTSSSDGTTVTSTTPPDNGTDPSPTPEIGMSCNVDSLRLWLSLT